MGKIKSYLILGLLIISTAFGCFHLGKYIGHSEGVSEERTEALKRFAEQTKEKEVLSAQLADMSLKLAEEEAKKKEVTKVVVKKVIEYVENPNVPECTVDDEWMRIKQSILNAADPRS